jgi:ATP-dependent DNA helicase Rep
VLECDSEEHEAERAVARIQALRGQGGGVQALADFAVLYRANHQAKVFEQKLRAAQIPYKVSGGQSYFDRAEIKDLCAWLRLLVNQDDDPAFLRAVTTPKRGIGHQTLAALGEFAAQWKLSLFEALFSPSLGTVLKGKAHGRRCRSSAARSTIWSTAPATPPGAEDARALLLGWLKDIGYEQHLHDGEDSEKLAAARWSNVLDFVDWIARRCGGELTQEGGGFESEKQSGAAGGADHQRHHQPGRARRRAGRGHAVHPARRQGPGMAARGAGRRQRGLAALQCSEDKNSEMTPERLEEERRLMYVGITRARARLVVSTLRRRKRGRDTVVGVPSRFIAEMKQGDSRPTQDPRERLKKLREELAARAASPQAQE